MPGAALERRRARPASCRGTAGFAHVSCLAEQAKILLDEAEENNLGFDAFNARWHRWHTCSMCEQEYHGIVRCALGWACWKTYVGRPEATQIRIGALSLLGNGLSAVEHHEDALVAYEAEMSMMRCVGAPEQAILTVQSCLAITYRNLGRDERALQIERDVYSGRLKLHGEEHEGTLLAANNYALALITQERFEESNALVRKMIPVARRVLGENNEGTLSMGKTYAMTLFLDNNATLDDLREAVTTLENTERIARRVLGGAYPLVLDMERKLQNARAALSARETGRRVFFLNEHRHPEA